MWRCTIVRARPSDAGAWNFKFGPRFWTNTCFSFHRLVLIFRPDLLSRISSGPIGRVSNSWRVDLFAPGGPDKIISALWTWTKFAPGDKKGRKIVPAPSIRNERRSRPRQFIKQIFWPLHCSILEHKNMETPHNRKPSDAKQNTFRRSNNETEYLPTPHLR